MYSNAIQERLNSAVNVYRKEIDTYKELGSQAAMDIKEIYRHIGLRFFHSCIDARIPSKDVPWMVDILPFNKFLKVI